MSSRNNTIFVLITLLLFFSIGTSFSTTKTPEKKDTPCPAQLDKHDEIVEIFLTKDNLDPERQKTGTDHLTVSQITPLKSTSFSDNCQQLNTVSQEAINTTWSNGTPKYNLSYYKVGNFYFIASTLRQTGDSDTVTVGLSFLFIYNHNYEKVADYSF